MNNNQHQNIKTKTVTAAVVGSKPINFTSKKQGVTCRHTVEAEVKLTGPQVQGVADYLLSATPIDGVEITTVDIPAAFLNFSGV